MLIEDIKEVSRIQLADQDWYSVEMKNGAIYNVPHNIDNKDFSVIQSYLNSVKKG